MVTNADHSNLNAHPNHDQIHPLGTVMELCLVLAISILFNVFPEKVGFVRSLTEPASFTPLLAPEFRAHLPWLNLYWGLAFSLGIANLIMLRWSIVTRFVQVALSILGIFVLIELVLGGPLTLYGWLDLFVKFGLAVAIIPAIIDVIRKVGYVFGNWEITVQPKQITFDKGGESK